MKTTIIIPCYNQGEYVSDAIESCLDQGAHEIIVINDGSTDNSREIIEKYPVKLINQVNKGLPSARNTGLMNATGDFILPLDADDMLVEGALKKMEAEIGSADILAPSFKCFGEHNNVVLLSDTKLSHFAEANRIGYFSLYRREKSVAIGGYSPRMLQGYEDYHFWIDMLSNGATLKVISDILVLYRTKKHSMIHEAQKHHDSLIVQIKKDFPALYEN